MWDVRTIPGRLAGEGSQNPIVRIAPGQPGVSYVVFQTFRQGFHYIEAARSMNNGMSYSVISQVAGPVGPLAQVDGAGGRAVRNLVWQHFAVQPVQQRLLVSYEDLGRVYATTSTNGMSWTSPVQVAAARPGADTIVVGASSPNGTTWASYEVTTTPPDGSIPFEPCPSGDGSAPGYFGDYVGIVPLALPTDQPASLVFYGAWADSRLGCSMTDRFTAVHHHTVGARFL
jgi:hypothetical protein